MDIYKIAYSRLSHWSHTDLAYLQQDPSLDPFMAYRPGLNQFPKVIEQRKKYKVDRALLLRVLKKQYLKLDISLPVKDEVILDENTFTLTTSHQPTLLTGPIYHIYKIAGTIHLANELKKTSAQYNFLPVFVLGSEDHDWPEVNHLNLFGRRYEWERTASGACGRMSLDGLEHLIDSIAHLFSNTPFGNNISELIHRCLQKAENYGEFHQALIHNLFDQHGLIVLHMDDPDLKRAFIPIMEKEIREQLSMKYVLPTQSSLEKFGFKAQAYCRPINLFYLSEQRRERIDPVEGGFIRVETGIKYTVDQLVNELHQHPENFSPNVILRPLYQEYILPNLAFIGGGGEIAYWLERKAQFEAAGVHFPMLIRRNSLMLIDASTSSQLAKADLKWEDMLVDYDSIAKDYIRRHTAADLNFSTETEMIREAYQRLAQKAEKTDPTLSKAILAEETKQLKQFEQLGSRLMRAEKQHHDTNLKRIQKLKEKLFPGGGLQERYENFLPYFATAGTPWIDSMINICNPLEEEFIVALLQE